MCRNGALFAYKNIPLQQQEETMMDAAPSCRRNLEVEEYKMGDRSSRALGVSPISSSAFAERVQMTIIQDALDEPSACSKVVASDDTLKTVVPCEKRPNKAKAIIEGSRPAMSASHRYFSAESVATPVNYHECNMREEDVDAFFEDFDFPSDIGPEIEDDQVFGILLEQMVA